MVPKQVEAIADLNDTGARFIERMMLLARLANESWARRELARALVAFEARNHALAATAAEGKEPSDAAARAYAERMVEDVGNVFQIALLTQAEMHQWQQDLLRKWCRTAAVECPTA